MPHIQDPSDRIKEYEHLKKVFVGNIPYNTHVIKIKKVFDKIGPVLRFEIIYDRKRGRSKGYGFCEFYDIETATMAIRKLNGYRFGHKSLRVNSIVNKKGKEKFKDLMDGEKSRKNESVIDKNLVYLNKIIAQLSPNRLSELFDEMKRYIIKYPNKSSEIFNQNPKLVYTLLRAHFTMKFVEKKEFDKPTSSNRKCNDAQQSNNPIPKSEPHVREAQVQPHPVQQSREMSSEYVTETSDNSSLQQMNSNESSCIENQSYTEHTQEPENFDAQESEFNNILPATTNYMYNCLRYQFDRTMTTTHCDYGQLHNNYPGMHECDNYRPPGSIYIDRSPSSRGGIYYQDNESRYLLTSQNMQNDPTVLYNQPIRQFDGYVRDSGDLEYNYNPQGQYQSDQDGQIRR